MPIIWLPWQRPPQSLNDRANHHVKAKATAQALGEARWAVRAARLQPFEFPVYVLLGYRVPDQRRRDVDNLGQVLKVCTDALVAEGLLPDDNWRFVRASGQTIHPPEPGRPGGMWLEVGQHGSGFPLTA